MRVEIFVRIVLLIILGVEVGCLLAVLTRFGLLWAVIAAFMLTLSILSTLIKIER